MAAISSVLVVGAGELGLAVIDSISATKADQGQAVSLSVLLRPSKSSSGQDEVKSKQQADLFSRGCKVIYYDIASLNIEQLASIFVLYDAVISCTGFAAGPGTQIKITRAALQAKVKRFFPWQFGVDYDTVGRGSGQDLFDEQLDVRDLLRSQVTTDWVIVTCGIFMSFVFEDSFGIVQGVRSVDGGPISVHALGSWENGLCVTDVADIGNLTAKILFDETVARQVVYIAGDSVSYRSLAEVVKRLSGRPVETETWTMESLKHDLDSSPEDVMRKYRVSFAAGKGVMWDMADTYNHIHGIATTSVEQWMQQKL